MFVVRSNADDGSHDCMAAVNGMITLFRMVVLGQYSKNICNESYNIFRRFIDAAYRKVNMRTYMQA